MKGKRIAVTGRLPTLTRNQAKALIEACGAHYQSQVTEQTDVLVIGQYSKSLFDEVPYTKKEQLFRHYRQSCVSIVCWSEEELIQQAIQFFQNKTRIATVN